MTGYVRIHRSLIGHPAFRNDAEAMAFAWLVARAAWKPVRVRYKDHGIQLERGQLAISVRDFASAMDRDKAWVERLLKRLKCETMVETAAKTGVTVITICNYNEYQDKRVQVETGEKTPGKTRARQTQDTEQGREEGKKEEELSPNGDCPSDDAPSLRPEQVFEGYQALAKELGLPVPRDFTPERRQLVRARLAQFPMGDFLEVFAKCRGSPFLRGDARDGRTPLSFDWLMKKANFLKVLEGNYDS